MKSAGKSLQILKDYDKHITAMVLLMFLLHGAKLNAGVVGIDTEALIFGGESFYDGWLNTGRQGLVLLKHLFNNMTYNPYFAAVMTLLIFPIAVSAFFLLWNSVWGVKNNLVFWIIGGLLWISHPVLTEQFYFSLQSFEIALGFLMTAAALFLTLSWVEKRQHLWAFCVSIALLILLFSIYQAFVAFYIFGVISILLLQALREFSEGKQEMPVRAFRRTGRWFLVFIIAFFINTVVTQKFFSTSSYLAEQIHWGNEPLWKIFRYIFGHIRSVLRGRRPVFYSAFYGYLLLLSLILFVVYLYRHGRKDKSSCFILSFFYLALQGSPFLMTILQGGEPAVRSQFVLPAMTCLQALLCLWLAQDIAVTVKTAGRVILAGVLFMSLICGLGTAKTTWSLYYTDQLRYEQDVLLGRTLIERIELICAQESEHPPVVVVGTRPFQGNSSCVQGQVMGYSIFDWDATVEPIPFWSTRRVLGFLNVLGADYNMVSADRLEEALGYSANMPSWPAEDCVRIYNGMVVVKLSELK